MKLSFVAAVGAVLLGVTSARANFIALYTGSTNNVYNYTLRFTADQLGEVLKSGDTVTLYDVGISTDITAVVAPSAPAGQFTVNQQLVGVTPADLVGAQGLVDNPSLQNITFTYTGADRMVSQDFAGATITMIPTYALLRVGKESGSTHVTFPLIPQPPSQTDTSIRSVLLPAAQAFGPEPGTLGVMGLGAGALLVRRRKAGNITCRSRL